MLSARTAGNIPSRCATFPAIQPRESFRATGRSICTSKTSRSSIEDSMRSKFTPAFLTLKLTQALPATITQSFHKRTAVTAMHKALLRSRPTSPNQFVEPSPATLGVHTLGLEHGRDGLIYVPPSYKPDRPSPLIICLHGAGSNGRNGLSLLEGFPTVDER